MDQFSVSCQEGSGGPAQEPGQERGAISCCLEIRPLPQPHVNRNEPTCITSLLTYRRTTDGMGHPYLEGSTTQVMAFGIFMVDSVYLIGRLRPLLCISTTALCDLKYRQILLNVIQPAHLCLFTSFK